MSTTIEWTDETWNPVVGCTKVSPGCDNCYAIDVAHRRMGDVCADKRPACGSCGAGVDATGGLVVVPREGGQRIWAVVHDCGSGPRRTVPLGTAPRPASHIGAFVHHVCHGLLMGYPSWSILRFAWLHRGSFDPTFLEGQAKK